METPEMTIAKAIKGFDHFNIDLYIKYLIAKINKI
jgi:hypothetical protein